MRKFYVNKRKLKIGLSKMPISEELKTELKSKYLGAKFSFISLSGGNGFPVCIGEDTYCSSPICFHKYIGKRY